MRARKRPAPTDRPIPNNTDAAKPNSRISPTAVDMLPANAGRFAASRRMVPLPPCSCIHDPDVDRHRCADQISDQLAHAAVTAVAHLNRLGTPALLDDRTCRAMWRIGYHRLAEAVHRRTAGVT